MNDALYSNLVDYYLMGCIAALGFQVWLQKDVEVKEFGRAFRWVIVYSIGSWPMFFILLYDHLRKRWKK